MRRRFLLAATVSAVALLAGPPGRGDEPETPSAERRPAAVVIGVTESAAVERPGRAPQPLDALAVLAEGDVVVPAAKGAVSLLLPDGRVAELRERRRLEARGAEAPAASASFATLLETVERLGDGRGAPPIVTRDHDVPIPLAPRLLVRTPRPAFRWRASADRGAYRLTIRRKRGKSRTVVRREVVRESPWHLPEETGALAAGIYEFDLEVIASEDGSSAAAGADALSESLTFFVPSEEERRAIDERLAAFERTLPEGDAWLRHVLRACFFESDGIYLLLEAHRELREALRLKPDDATTRTLLKNVEVRLGWPPEE